MAAYKIVCFLAVLAVIHLHLPNHLPHHFVGHLAMYLVPVPVQACQVQAGVSIEVASLGERVSRPLLILNACCKQKHRSPHGSLLNLFPVMLRIAVKFEIYLHRICGILSLQVCRQVLRVCGLWRSCLFLTFTSCCRSVMFFRFDRTHRSNWSTSPRTRFSGILQPAGGFSFRAFKNVLTFRR